MSDDHNVERSIAKLGGERILTADDVKELSEGCKRVLAMMQDGNWYSADDIRVAAGTNGAPASEGLRRLRELRDAYIVEKRRVGETRLWEYRLLPKGTLF